MSTFAPNVWDPSVAPGGMVCSACGMPTESEPCAEHQCRHEWLDRPESDTQVCLVCGVES